MKRLLVVLVGILSLSSISVKATNPFSSNVVALTPQNWKEEVVDSPHAVFVNICRVGWGYCQQLQPEWERLAGAVKGQVVSECVFALFWFDLLCFVSWLICGPINIYPFTHILHKRRLRIGTLNNVDVHRLCSVSLGERQRLDYLNQKGNKRTKKIGPMGLGPDPWAKMEPKRYQRNKHGANMKPKIQIWKN